jgi:GTPase SAR1 family protein
VLEKQALLLEEFQEREDRIAQIGEWIRQAEEELLTTDSNSGILTDTPMTATPINAMPAQRVDYTKLKTELVYGRSGSGKTSWLLKLARYIFLRTGKKTRWYLGDGGGETVTITGWADEGGFIDLWPYIVRNNPMETSQLICEGYWPVGDPLDPKCRLAPPTPKDFDEVGLWIYEGLTVMSDYMMGDKEGGLANRMSRGETINKDDSFRFKDGDIMFGGNARTHYGFVQRKMLDLIQRTTRLSGIKYWTAHELKVDDTEYREAMYGPDVCGQKLTSRIGGSFGNTIHMQVAHIEKEATDPVTAKKVKKIEESFRAYTRNHFDADGQTTAKYYANTRMDARVREKYPDLMPEFLSPADPIRFYGLLDEAQNKEGEFDALVEALPEINLIRKPSPDRTRNITL